MDGSRAIEHGRYARCETIQRELLALDIRDRTNRRIARIELDLRLDRTAGGVEVQWIERQDPVAQDKVCTHPMQRQRFVTDSAAGEMDIGVGGVELVEVIFRMRQQ